MIDNWDAEAEQRFALRAGELLRPAFEEVKSKLPPGTPFGIIIEAPAPDGQLGRAIVISTDRKRVGLLAAQWIVNAEPFG